MLKFGPGTRNASSTAQKYYVLNFNVHRKTKGVNCLIAAAINAVYELGLNNVALYLEQKRNWNIFRDMTDLSRWMRHDMKGFQLIGGQKKVISYNDLLEACEGIFRLCLVGRDHADHVVVYNAQKRYIIDSEEPHPSSFVQKYCMLV